VVGSNHTNAGLPEGLPRVGCTQIMACFKMPSDVRRPGAETSNSLALQPPEPVPAAFAVTETAAFRNCEHALGK